MTRTRRSMFVKPVLSLTPREFNFDFTFRPVFVRQNTTVGSLFRKITFDFAENNTPVNEIWSSLITINVSESLCSLPSIITKWNIIYFELTSTTKSFERLCYYYTYVYATLLFPYVYLTLGNTYSEVDHIIESKFYLFVISRFTLNKYNVQCKL